MAIGAFFLLGHDEVAEAAVVLAEYGSVPAFLINHGYAPGGKNPGWVLAACKQREQLRTKRPRETPPA